ncbi:MAG: FHA domain-containing protein [Pseudomonadota bacterium]
MEENIKKHEPQEEAELEFPINQELLNAATQAKEQWRVIRDRLNKIEDHKEKVADVVYRRVLADYKERIKEVTQAVLEKKANVDKELASLQGTRESILKELEGHRHSLEEIKFRNTLGEYSGEEYQNAAREEQDKISKFETVLSAVNSNIHRYESIFENEPDLFAAQEAAGAEEEQAEVSEPSGVLPIAHGAEPITDESGYVIEGEGPSYFSTTEPDGTHPGIDESATAKAPAGLGEREIPEAGGMPVRIVFISGEDAGAAFPVKGTVSFGRAESNSVTIRDAKVSRQHAQIQQQGNEYVLVDLNSSNGTYVNGERVEEHVLSNGDEIMIGDCIMQFQM